MKETILVFAAVISLITAMSATLAWGEDDMRRVPIITPDAISQDLPKPVPLLEEPLRAEPLDAEPEEVERMDTLLYESEGIVLSQGRNTRAIGPLRLKSYRLVQISLPHPRDIQVRGRVTRVDRAWRLTITGGPFPVRALPYIIWVGDIMVGNARESGDLSALSAVTFDRSVLVEGATVSISYGENGPRLELPERLVLRDLLRE